LSVTFPFVAAARPSPRRKRRAWKVARTEMPVVAPVTEPSDAIIGRQRAFSVSAGIFVDGSIIHGVTL
jgi:hypothetical protein